MAISTALNQATGLYYDPNRDMYISQEEQYRLMQMHARAMQDPRHVYGNAIQGGHHAEQQKQAQLVDPRDPLAFLKKADNKLLLTGETQ